MVFWFFMLGMVLLLPLTMIGLGNHFRKGGPKKINGVFGYRSPMSAKNRDTWVFAHRYCGRLWCAGGWILLPFSVAAMLAVRNRGETAVSVAGNAAEILQLIFMAASIFFTERTLKRAFDADGNRR